MKLFIALLFSILTTTAVAAEPTSANLPVTGKAPVTEKAPAVLLKTSAGDITLELDPKLAPSTVANFLQYVNEGFYSNTLFHRVIPDFMIQGGGFQSGMIEKPTRAPVANESSNGKQNKRGSIAMARTQNPDSATAQFFINLVDNAYLDGSSGKPGYTVFGQVVKGMEVVDKIAGVTTAPHGPHGDVPVQDVVIISATLLTDK